VSEIGLSNRHLSLDLAGFAEADIKKGVSRGGVAVDERA